jgi:hypothetical protein
MLTKLYLGDYADSYYMSGGPLSLCTTDWCKKAAEKGPSERLKYFKLVDEFDGKHSPDLSNGGFVRVYEVIYPEEMKEEEGGETAGSILIPPSNDTGTFATWE